MAKRKPNVELSAPVIKNIKVNPVKIDPDRTKGARCKTFAVVPKGPGSPHNEDIIFFYSSSDAYGGPFKFLSNFYPCEFKEPNMVRDHTWNCGEQYYQCAKAIGYSEATVVYNAHKVPSNVMYHIIMMETDAKIIAEQGRSFDFNGERWTSQWRPGFDANVENILLMVARAKYGGQDRELSMLLLKTGTHMLVEASAADSEGGIGVHIEEAFGKKKWGKNVLGEVLMKVRDELRELWNYHEGYDEKFWQARFDEHGARRQKRVDKDKLTSSAEI
ncbi:hypothetical protein LTR17_000249 [Elasticomyces elasticus]|nr:hypothetical protein LTR17_000249 [Elasticomyces elasticus]